MSKGVPDWLRKKLGLIDEDIKAAQKAKQERLEKMRKEEIISFAVVVNKKAKLNTVRGKMILMAECLKIADLRLFGSFVNDSFFQTMPLGKMYFNGRMSVESYEKMFGIKIKMEKGILILVAELENEKNKSIFTPQIMLCYYFTEEYETEIPEGLEEEIEEIIFIPKKIVYACSK